MSFEEILSELENRGKDTGYILNKDINRFYKQDTKEYEKIENYFLDKGLIILSEQIKPDFEVKEEDLYDDKLLSGIDSSINKDTSDTIKMYLKEIGEISLLSLEEEREICSSIYHGKLAFEQLELVKNDELEVDEETHHKLRELAYASEMARARLVESNYRLVISIAKKYTNRGLQFLDLIQEGNMGLMKAVDKFDCSKGFKFSTYSTWWIRQSISRAIADQGKTIRVPVHMVETINRVYRTQRKLIQELGRDPSNDEIATEMGLSVEKIQAIQRISQEPISLESTVGEDEDSTLIDFIADENILNPDEYIANEALKKEIDDALSTLTNRERIILRMRFGIPDGHICTLEEVGQKFGVTRERIRQIETKAIRKLRHPSRNKRLASFIKKP